MRTPGYLAGYTLPASLQATNDLAEAVEGADLVIVAVPARRLRAVMGRHGNLDGIGAARARPHQGIEAETGRRVTEVLREVAAGHGRTPSGCSAGPNLAAS